MILKSFRCRNFRNYDYCSIELNPSINVFLGNNAQGKTNLLEGIFFLSTSKSHRIHDDKAMIKNECEFSNLECVIQDHGRDTKLAAVIHSKGKTLMIDHNPCKKTSDFIGKLNVILFSPSDLSLFDDSPKDRRRCMDIEIGKVSSFYTRRLSNYSKLLKERNSILKRENIDSNYIDVIDQRIAEEEVDIIKYRTDFISNINKKINQYYKYISNSDNQVELRYSPLVDIDKKEVMISKIIEISTRNRQRDKVLQNTSFGVHRDDYSFWMDDKVLSSVASQGQRRMVILAMKLALIDYVKEKKNNYPILLLDDVLSELDFERRANLLKALPDQCQTLITTTDLDECRNLNKSIRIFNVEDGNIKQKGV